MSKNIIVFTMVCVLSCMLIGFVNADRLILIPTGRTLSTASVKAEAAINSGGDGTIYWANIGVSRFEAEGARFQDFGTEDVDAFSAQFVVLPETSFTPAVAIGARDIADDTSGTPYDGRAFYVVASKKVPVTGGVPLLFQDVVIHSGYGTGSLSGLFFGVEGTLPMGLRVGGEFDTEDWNFSASFNIIPTLQVKAYSIKGDFYYGAQFSTSF